MLGIGDKFPDFELTGVVSNDAATAFQTVNSQKLAQAWKVVFFWPKDFTFVCPTEIAAFGKLNGEFADRDAQVLGVSVDSEFVHLAWRRDHKDLNDLPFPMLADIKRELTAECGVLNADGVADRATFIVDQDNTIQFAMVTAGSVGRNVDEVLRVLDALQTDELCPCNWQNGESTLDTAKLMAEA
ncbi:MAG TPA: peroxiredoxin [Actinospica sp.]|jgi:peroxiredoxin (alkyl hydroperoxide reductase subunit C)|nr:peroxiredoxin [Actinospica sp.]